VSAEFTKSRGLATTSMRRHLVNVGAKVVGLSTLFSGSLGHGVAGAIAYYSHSLCSDVLCSDLAIGTRGSGHVGANAPGRSVTIAKHHRSFSPMAGKGHG
jgi:hypothetical protein